MEDKREQVINSWTGVVNCLFALRLAWDKHRQVVTSLGRLGLEGLPISVLKHVGQFFNKTKFDKAMSILVQYWAVRGGLGYLLPDEDEVEEFLRVVNNEEPEEPKEPEDEKEIDLSELIEMDSEVRKQNLDIEYPIEEKEEDENE